MAFPCEVEWRWPETPDGEAGSTALVRTACELRQLLVAIRAGADARQIAIAICVATPKDNLFSVVLGLGSGSIVTYDGLGGNPPYFVSVGDPKKDLSLVSYFFGGQLNELPASHVIPEELAVRALVDSIEFEQPSSLIQWYGS